jgi:AcrR family transcriptional regulator
MNRNDIISAAFRAWAREGYRKMSLTDVAAELGVTKPALYRHFRDKSLLLDAMGEAFFDRYAASLFRASPDGFSGGPLLGDRLLSYMETIVLHFGGDVTDLAYLFGRVMVSREPEQLFRRMLADRGIGVASSLPEKEEDRWLVANVVSTGFFLVAMHHLARKGRTDQPSSEELRSLADASRGVCARGLGVSREALLRLDYGALEEAARLEPGQAAATDGLLPAVAAVVAEVGAWNASMDMVAKRSGISKSGLYAHFRSKEDMLSRLFSTEFERISAVLSDKAALSAVPQERLYLAQAAAANYLLARPDVLVALDWMRTQHLDLGDLTPQSLDGAFAFLRDEAAAGRIALLPGGFGPTLRWILFLTVHQLVHREADSPQPEFPGRRLRALHAFILCGAGAAGYDEKRAI